MRVEFVTDMSQYSDCVAPLADFLRDSGIEVTFASFNSIDTHADAHVVLQDFALLCCPAPRVFIPHGLSLLKKFDFAHAAELMVVPSNELFEATKSTIAAGSKVLKGVGYPKIDRLLERSGEKPECRARIDREHGFDGRPLVVYAPTYKHKGSVPHGNRCYKLQDVETELLRHFNVITLHHNLETALDEVAELKARPAQSLERLNYIIGADAVVTDNSGVSFECAAIGKPIAFVTNPGDPEYLRDKVLGTGKTLDFGPVATIETLSESVTRLLAKPSAFAERGYQWAQSVFGPLDGKASERIGTAIIEAAIEQIRSRLKTDRARQGSGSVLLGDFVATRMHFFARPIGGKATRQQVDFAIDPAQGATVFYGPYLNLGPGKFAVEMNLDCLAGAFEGEFIASANRGEVTLFSVAFEQRLCGRYVFVVPGSGINAKSIEFVLRRKGGTRCDLRITTFKLYRLP